MAGESQEHPLTVSSLTQALKEMIEGRFSRIYVEAEGGIELPLDFDPEEAEEIAEELRAAAEAARDMGAQGNRRR